MAKAELKSEQTETGVEDFLTKLDECKLGKNCFYSKKLSGADEKVLENID